MNHYPGLDWNRIGSRQDEPDVLSKRDARESNTRNPLRGTTFPVWPRAIRLPSGGGALRLQAECDLDRMRRIARAIAFRRDLSL